MRKFEVVAVVWSDEFKQQIKKVVGEFDSIVNASLFKEAYEKHYSSKTELVEWKTVD